tara:strand:- start:179 stop:514 length:336 start_codon:yes stop_codon:yes gene_type:complete
MDADQIRRQRCTKEVCGISHWLQECKKRHTRTPDNYEFLKVLACKLPKALQQQWIKIVGRCREEEDRAPRFEDLEKYVSRLSRDENDPRIAGLGYQGHTQNGDNNNNNIHL